MLRQVLLATHNKNKIEEIRYFFSKTQSKILTFEDIKKTFYINETGKTFEENAILKAETVFKHTNIITLSDDSGLEVDELDGAPGVSSARFAGVPSSDNKNNAKLLDMMKEIPESLRQARFTCVMALAGPDETHTFHGLVEGKIAAAAAGGHGFGYDPLFIPAGYDKTFAELGDEIKAAMSHRSHALTKVINFLKSHT